MTPLPHPDGDAIGPSQKVQWLHLVIMPFMTRTLPTDSLLSNKSQSFSIVWTDNTDSICDLPSVLTFLDNFTSKRYRTNTTSSSPVTGRSDRGASNGVEAPSSPSSSSSLLKSPQIPLRVLNCTHSRLCHTVPS
jgi:hypothetical protein